MGPDGALQVPDEPIIPFIEGDGTGVDIWPAATLVLDAAAAKHGSKIAWKEVLAGEKAFKETGDWLPDETVDAFREHLIGIKGPLTTPVGGGIRSLNVALRQILDLYVCLRPVRWFAGVPSPVLPPREGRHGDLPGEHRGRLRRLRGPGGHARGRPSSPPSSATRWAGRSGTTRASASSRSPRSAPSASSAPPSTTPSSHDRTSVTLVHKGNIQKFTEGAFRNWGYDLVREEFADVAVGWDDCGGEPGDKLLVKDTIADITLQQVLTRPDEFDVIATTNLNGDYLSDALAAQVGRDRHRPGRQHQLRHRPRRLRGHPRHRAQVRRARTRSTRARCSSRGCSCSSTWAGPTPPTTSCAPSRRPSPTRSSPTTSPG